MPDIKILNPDALGKPLGQYSHMTRVKASEFLFIAGQVATDRDGKVVGADDFDAQCVQTFANIEAALRSAGAGFGNVVQFTTYLVHSQDTAKFMTYRLREFPKLFANGAYPPNTLLMVDRLVQEPFLIEVQAVAALCFVARMKRSGMRGDNPGFRHSPRRWAWIPLWLHPGYTR